MSRLPDQGPRWRGAISQLSLASSMWIAIAMVLGSIAPAAAQVDPTIPPEMAERFAFDAADSNDDGVVDEAELARDAAVGFSSLDKNRDEKLTPQESGRTTRCGSSGSIATATAS